MMISKEARAFIGVSSTVALERIQKVAAVSSARKIKKKPKERRKNLPDEVYEYAADLRAETGLPFVKIGKKVEEKFGHDLDASTIRRGISRIEKKRVR